MEQGEANSLFLTPTLQDLISCYRRTAPTTQNTTKTLGSFASLSITEPKPRKQLTTDRSRCVCGLHLSLLQCFTLNPEAEGRSKDYKPSLKALSQLVQAFRNKDTLRKAKKAYKDCHGLSLSCLTCKRASPSVRCDYSSYTSAVYSHSCISTVCSFT
jgi:hypothetical protein